MKKVFFAFLLLAYLPLYADSAYIVGGLQPNVAAYWPSIPPAEPTSSFVLDIGNYQQGNARAVAFAPNKTVYIVGDLDDGDESTIAGYWTVSPTGVASDFIPLTEAGSNVTALSLAFDADDVVHIVGRNGNGSACLWTVSPEGVFIAETELDQGLYATAVAFTSTGIGYISGTDQMSAVCYWAIDLQNAITGPFYLTGGESGGAAYPYAVAVTPSDDTYIVGASRTGYASYWIISAQGVASGIHVLDGNSNSIATGVAFKLDGSGIIVGQGTGNVSCYWSVASDGSTGLLSPLPNGNGSSSLATGVAYYSDGTAYITGNDNGFNAVYWTLPPNESEAVYHLLPDGALGITSGIALDWSLLPTPENLTGTFVKNSFGWIYEYCLVLKWSLSDSELVVGYNIYKNGIKIGAVGKTTAQFDVHNQSKSQNAVYAVTSVDAEGNESDPATININ